jgi:hypothetical protein
MCVAFLGGLGLVSMVRPAGPPRLGSSGTAGAALILGAGAVSISTFCLGFLLHGWQLRSAAIGICLGLFFYGRSRTPRSRGTGARTLSAPHLVFVTLLTVSFCFTAWFSVYRDTLEWDGLFIWEAKARIAFLNHGSIPLSYYAGANDYSHRGYPLLLPLFEAWIYGFAGRADQSMAKLAGPYFYLAALLLIAAASHRQRDRWPRIVVLLPFALVPALIAGFGSASSGYADFPLAAAYLCAAVPAIEYWRTRSSGWLPLTGVSAMLLPFIKPEGAILLLCCWVALAPRLLRSRDWRGGAWLLLPGLSTKLGWTLFLAVMGLQAEHVYEYSLAYWMSHLDRARPLLGWAIEELTTLERWSLLWPLTAVSLAILVLRSRRSRTEEWYPWAALTALPLLIYPCAYFFSTLDPVEVHVRTSLPRLFLHASPAAALLVGLVLAGLVEPARDQGPEACGTPPHGDG